MKSFFSLALFALSALAQNAHIGVPVEGQTVTAGEELIVQVQRPVSFDPGCITTEFIRLISAELSEPIC
jgi:hypothetical protein